MDTSNSSSYNRCFKCSQICAKERLIKYQSHDTSLFVCTFCYTDIQLQSLRKQNHSSVRKSKCYQPKSSWFQRLGKKNRVYLTNSTWERDLTRENIESNPGPVFEIQSRDIISLKNELNAVAQFSGKSNEETIILIEDVCLFLSDLFSGHTKKDYVRAIMHFIKHRTQKSVLLLAQNKILEYFEHLFMVQVQGVEDSLDILRSFFKSMGNIPELETYKKLKKFVIYVLSMNLFDAWGLDFKTFGYSRMEEEGLRRVSSSKVGLVYCILDLILYLCKKGFQCYKTGSWEPIYHSSDTYTEWYKVGQELMDKKVQLGNPSAFDLDVPEYIGKVTDHIASGKSILKYSDNFAPFETKIVRNLVGQLSLMKDEQLCREFACQDRPFPFGLLIFGSPGVCKSAFRQICYVHYAKIHNKNPDSKYMYTRDGFNEYWTNFRSDQWCIAFDDISFWDPSKAPNGDPTLMEVLQVFNNGAYCPPQASLEDKGKTPIRCELGIATTNVEDLNASYYFTCPLAARRRLPFVVEIKMKSEYRKDGSCMADVSTIPDYAPGEYMDVWEITVKQVVACRGSSKGRAQLKIVKVYDNIHHFLRWFSIVTLKHKANQKKATACGEATTSSPLCDSCKALASNCICDQECLECSKPVNDCKCLDIQTNALVRMSEEEEFSRHSVPQTPVQYSCMTLLRLICVYVVFQDFIFCRFLVTTLCYSGYSDMLFSLCCDSAIRKQVLHVMGNKIKRKVGENEKLLKIAGCVSAVLGALYIYKKLTTDITSSKVEGNNFSKPRNDNGIRPKVSKPEPENVWFNDNYELSSFDVGLTTASWRNLNFNTAINKISNNLISLVCVEHFEGYDVETPAKGVCIKGNVYMFNNHCIPKSKTNIHATLVHCTAVEGVSGNKSLIFSEASVKRFPERDLCFVEILGLPPKKDISGLFMTTKPAGKHNGVLLSRSEEGDIVTRVCKNIHLERTYIPDLKCTSDLWMSFTNQATESGDCGSVLVTHSDSGPIILGIHVVKVNMDKIKIGSHSVTQLDISKGLAQFETQIQSGEPLISAPSAKRNITSLHQKSVFRFMQKGTAEVFGSFSGFKQAGKSRVEDTLISASILKRGYTKTHTRPVMSGWEPWRLAALELCNPNTEFLPETLEECSSAYLNDVLSALSLEDLGEVVVYDDFTAVNGCAGLKYIDKMNRNTSAGCPWQKGKKYFNENVPSHPNAPDPVMPNKEIMDRVDHIISEYKQGRRYCPVFKASLKDEPVSFKKAVGANTRVFAAAPYDWSIVVRKYYLSLTRLIQKNKFIFEAAPGTVCQSDEWSDIYQYLTHHGDKQIVAGDYKKYDKRMSPQIMMCAFRILVRIAERCGYDDESLLIMRGIAVDTCYPVMDYNGELVQFYGSNPSGQPLTVHINCIVNSLYMRYSYSMLVSKPVSTFKSNVNLITYGDDNAMGISPAVSDVFNHTSISKALASIDVVYTMADKDAESVPLLSIDQISFLKRTWRWDQDMETYHCPLEHDSIQKMLITSVRSKGMTPEHHSVAIIASALREYFFYGKKKFLEKRKMFIEVIAENELEDFCDEYTLPTYQELVSTFRSATKRRN